MPMERSVSCAAERSAAYAPAATDLRCHSASYAASYAPPPPPKQVKRATSLSRPAAVQQSGSTNAKAAAVPAGGPTPGLNLRCYSASYAASYSPFSDGAAAAAGAQQAKGPNGGATWSAAGRRSVNLRGYTPSFSALDDAAAAPVPAKKAAPTGASFVDDAKLQRRKRLVAYKVYDVEGKVKDSVRRSVKWIKGKCSRAVHGSGGD